MTTISAIVPTVGRSSVQRAIDSIRRQTTPVDEIVVVYDTVEEPREGPAGTRWVWTGGVGNACAARNLGGKVARSDYLAFLDDDDYWLESHIACVRRAIASTGALVLCTSFSALRDGVIRPEKSAPESIAFHAFFCRNPGFRGSNLIVETEAFSTVGGFDEALPAHNDLDLGIRIADLDLPYHAIEERTVIFCPHPGPRLSTRGGAANRQGILAFWHKYRQRMSVAERRRYVEWVTDYWGFDDFQELSERSSS